MAWPLAVVFLLMIYRIEIVKLSERLKRARLPGGTDLDFDAQQLAQKAANETPELSSQDESPQVSSLILERISSEPELGLAQLRIELERIVRAIYLLGAVKKNERRPMSIGRMTQRLESNGQLPSYITGYLNEVISLTNRAVHGETVSRDTAQDLGGLGVRLLEVLRKIYLEKISEPVQSFTITGADRDHLEESRYRVTTAVPSIDDPQINVRVLSQEGLDSLLDGYDEYSEFLVAIEPIDTNLPDVERK